MVVGLSQGSAKSSAAPEHSPVPHPSRFVTLAGLTRNFIPFPPESISEDAIGEDSWIVADVPVRRTPPGK